MRRGPMEPRKHGFQIGYEHFVTMRAAKHESVGKLFFGKPANRAGRRGLNFNHGSRGSSPMGGRLAVEILGIEPSSVRIRL